jgi:hypothetical protein
MAELSYYWNGPAYSDDQFSDIFRYLFQRDLDTEGVLVGQLNELAPSLVGSNIVIQSGVALVDGKIYVNDAPLSVALTTPAVGIYYHTVVLRKDFGTQTVRAALLTNAAGYVATTHTPGATWEIEIARATVTAAGVRALTLDARDFCNFSTEVSVGDISPVGSNGQIIKSDGLASAWAPIIDKRQGGSATVWSTEGDTDYTPVGCLIQCGSKAVVVDNGTHLGTATVTFPEAFAFAPIVLITVGNFASSDVTHVSFGVNTITTTTFVIDIKQSVDTDRVVFWMAIGPR